MLEPGPETDLKVAEACGIAAVIEFGKCCKLPMAMMLMYPPTFQPSTDLNDAFLAAEKVGLFDEAAYSLQHWHCGWSVIDESMELRNEPARMRLIQATCTPALAICAAILKLSDAFNSNPRR